MNKKIITIFIIILLVVIGLVFFSDNIIKKNNSDKINSSTSTLSTYVSEKYGFSFKYPENVTIYEKGDKEFTPPSHEHIIAWGETDETYPNPVKSNASVPYRITILEGRHPFETKNYERITTFKEKSGKVFTIRYSGPTTAITTDPIPAIKNSYETISQSFEIK